MIPSYIINLIINEGLNYEIVIKYVFQSFKSFINDLHYFSRKTPTAGHLRRQKIATTTALALLVSIHPH